MPAYKIEEKSRPTFIVFDIKDFYPSISKYFLQKAFEFAKTKVSITQDKKKIIYHSRKSLFKNKETWIKKELFNVTMGAYGGAEICELAGLFMLYKFQQLNNVNNFGLYRNDMLAVVKNMSGPQLGNV